MISSTVKSSYLSTTRSTVCLLTFIIILLIRSDAFQSHAFQKHAHSPYNHDYAYRRRKPSAIYSTPKQNRHQQHRNTEAIKINNAISKLGRQRNWKEMLYLYEEKQTQFNNVNFSTTMNQLGKIRGVNRNDPLFVDFVEELARKIEQNGLQWMDVRGASNIVHAIGKMHLKQLKGSIKIMEIVSVEENIRWLAKAGNSQDIANTAWAYATLGIESPLLFAEIEKRASWLVNEGNTQSIANTAWAFAKLGQKSSDFFKEIEKCAEWFVNKGKVQEVANTAWAFATLDVTSPNFFSEVEKQAEWLVNEGSTQEVANTLWATRHFKYDTPNLIAEADKHNRWLIEEGNAQDIANTALAYATVGYETTTFFRDLEENTSDLLEKGNVQNICNTCYSLVILDFGKKHNSLLSNLWTKLMKIDANSFHIEDIYQLAQVETYAKLDGINLLEPSVSLRSRMNNADNADTKSRSQSQISSLLSEMSFIHEEKVCPLPVQVGIGIDGRVIDANGMLSIDMACRERRIAIEYDGSHHFLISLPKGEVMRKEDGPTKAKRRYLERSGWTVVNLDYRDYMECKGKKRRMEWLKSELAKVGVSNDI